MINIRTIKGLKNDDGLTLKKGKRIAYKTGYQVATEGIETTDAREAINAVKAYKGDSLMAPTTLTKATANPQRKMPLRLVVLASRFQF